MMNSEFTNQDYIFMSQAIKLASKGQFTVRSNPLVGCVLVKNNQVIGKVGISMQADLMLKLMQSNQP